MYVLFQAVTLVHLEDVGVKVEYGEPLYEGEYREHSGLLATRNMQK